MNQILDHSGPKRSKVNRNPADTEKIVKVFAIFIIIFAISFIGKGAYSFINNNNILNKDKNSDKYSNGPVIVLKADEDLLTIEVSYKSAIESISYQWYRGKVTSSDIEKYLQTPEDNTTSESDDEIEEEDENKISALGTQQVQKGTGESIMNLKNIGIPKGDSTIHITVVAQGNVTTEYIQSYHTDVGVDKIAPVIRKPIIQGTKAIIIASDETEISSIIYSINDGPEITIDDRQDKKTIKAEIELDTSKENKLKIAAVDKANNTGMSSPTIDLYAGIPKIEFSAEPDMSKIYVNVSYSKGVTKIEYEFNGESFTEEFSRPKKEYEFEVDSKEGYNLISVKAYTSEESVYAEEAGELEYNP